MSSSRYRGYLRRCVRFAWRNICRRPRGEALLYYASADGVAVLFKYPASVCGVRDFRCGVWHFVGYAVLRREYEAPSFAKAMGACSFFLLARFVLFVDARRLQGGKLFARCAFVRCNTAGCGSALVIRASDQSSLCSLTCAFRAVGSVSSLFYRIIACVFLDKTGNF